MADKHLYKNTDSYDMPEVWCGDMSFEYSEKFEEVTCVECLTLASDYGADAAKQLAALQVNA